jgi:hypothetical protein
MMIIIEKSTYKPNSMLDFFVVVYFMNELLSSHKQEKLKPGASSPGAKQYGDGLTDG